MDVQRNGADSELAQEKLSALVAAEARRRALREQIYEAYQSGQPEIAAELEAQLSAE